MRREEKNRILFVSNYVIMCDVRPRPCHTIPSLCDSSNFMSRSSPLLHKAHTMICMHDVICAISFER